MNIPHWLRSFHLPEDVIGLIESYVSLKEREAFENVLITLFILKRPSHSTLRTMKRLGIYVALDEKQKEKLNDYLLDAVAKCYTFAAELLLELGADVNYFGSVDLDSAIWKASKSDSKQYKVMREFHEAKPHFKYNSVLISILNQQLEMTRLLVRFKCDLNTSSVYTRVGGYQAYSSYPSSSNSQDPVIPLHHAIASGDASTQLCIYLVENGADPHVEGPATYVGNQPSRKSTIRLAATVKNRQLVEFFVQQGVYHKVRGCGELDSTDAYIAFVSQELERREREEIRKNIQSLSDVFRQTNRKLEELTRMLSKGKEEDWI